MWAELFHRVLSFVISYDYSGFAFWVTDVLKKTTTNDGLSKRTRLRVRYNKIAWDATENSVLHRKAPKLFSRVEIT